MVGLFINTVPVRVRLARESRVGGCWPASRTSRPRLRAYHHVRLADVQRLAGVGELFDTVLVFENFPAQARTARADGCDWSSVAGRDALPADPHRRRRRTAAAAARATGRTASTAPSRPIGARLVARRRRLAADARTPGRPARRPAGAERGTLLALAAGPVPSGVGRHGTRGQTWLPAALRRAGGPHARTRWPSSPAVEVLTYGELDARGRPAGRAARASGGAARDTVALLLTRSVRPGRRPARRAEGRRLLRARWTRGRTRQAGSAAPGAGRRARGWPTSGRPTGPTTCRPTYGPLDLDDSRRHRRRPWRPSHPDIRRLRDVHLRLDGRPQGRRRHPRTAVVELGRRQRASPPAPTTRVLLHSPLHFRRRHVRDRGSRC